MLEIQNIRMLREEHIGGWVIENAESSVAVGYLNAPHYSIIFKRDGNAAAVLIDRNINPFLKKYHVYICWENFDNRIYETTLTKESISKKDTFLTLMMYQLNEQYNKQK